MMHPACCAPIHESEAEDHVVTELRLDSLCSAWVHTSGTSLRRKHGHAGVALHLRPSGKTESQKREREVHTDPQRLLVSSS